MTHTSVHFVFCSLRMKQKPPVNKEENSVFGDTPFQYTHTSLFPIPPLLHTKSLWQWLLIPPAASSSKLAQIPSDYTNDIIKYVCFCACA